ncbi:MAG TPA: hypothetical protein VHQ21_01435 [Rhodanobacteraceae bacterium]|jgi:hypothetical protein|nr:hypothetical protein [Rhodanobacteraceae bacterium]
MTARTNTARQTRHQRSRRDGGDTRIWFWLTPETRAVYDRLRGAFGERQEDMMAAALNALDADLGNPGIGIEKG